MTLHANIDEPQVQLTELVEAARRGEEVLLEQGGVAQARIVPIHIMSRQDKEEIAARRIANIGIFREKYAGVDLTVPPSMTDDEIEERFKRKFGAPYPSDD